jgi:hypothetical protein
MSGKHKDQLPGGLADDKEPGDFNPAALDLGRRFELEHTDDDDMATEIAMDHLVEDPDYYQKLAKMEGIKLRPKNQHTYVEGDDLMTIISTVTEVGNVLYDRGEFKLSEETARFIANLLGGR